MIHILRALDIFLSLIALFFLWPLMLLVFIIGFFDTGSPIFIQKRVGKNKKPFNLIKFRTMHVGTLSVASHLVSANNVTRFGSFIRRTKIDELPQLLNVLIGDMSIVGPRPNLYNQDELIRARDLLGIYKFRPGITGLSQINNIDMSTPELLANTDKLMMDGLNAYKYFYYIFKTALGSGSGDAIK